MKKSVFYLLALGSFIFACKTKDVAVSEAPSKIQITEVNIKHANVEALLKKMTLDEKIGQLNQYNGFYDLTGPAPQGGDAAKKYEDLRNGLVGSMLNIKGVDDIMKLQKIAVEESRLGIPLIFGYDIIHGYKTLSPIPLAEASSWDLVAIERSARIAAIEAASSGINWTFAPMVDISRDPRWGRVMEGAGEDPYLGSLIGKARVKGFQGTDLSDPLTIAACLKHFAGYGFSESGRDYNSVDMSKEMLHNVILPPFKAAVEAGAATVMNSFNDLNGVPATADAYLLRTILKGKYGFQGMVVSDWGSVGELVNHGYAEDGVDAAQKALKAGCDMDMESLLYRRHLKDLVEQGKLDIAFVDDAARRILNLKQDLGLFDDPYRYCNKERQSSQVYAVSHRTDVRDIARKSIVLLKNENNLLPLTKEKKIAVIGPMVDEKNSPLGSWRIASDDNTAVSLKEGLSGLKGYNFTYHQGVKLISKPASFLYETEINQTDRTGIAEAVAAAKQSEVVILAVGEHGFQSGEGRSRTRLDWPGLQQDLVKAVLEVNPNVILLNFSGRPLDLSWAAKQIPAIVQVWQLGTESGNAIADVLSGYYNPSGRLPMSFPRNIGQIPIYYGQKSTGRANQLPEPNMVFWSHYSDEANDALYPFGFGLSYHTVEYKNPVITVVGQQVHAQITVTNTSKVKGTETVQLYIHDVTASQTRPVKELKSFKQVLLQPGETQVVKLTIGRTELSYYDADGNMVFEPGDFDIMIGPNSKELQKQRVKVQ